MNDDQLRRIMEETARRLNQGLGEARLVTKHDFRKGTFAEQRNFLADTSWLKIAHCSRGAAKSYTDGLGIYEFLEAYPGCRCLYVTKTNDMAREIMWDTVMKAIDKDFDVGMDFNEVRLEGRHPNGSSFKLVGIDSDKKQQDKLLGGKPKLVVLDEVSFFDTDLTPIVFRTLIPALARVGGSLWMSSTSSDLTQGLFYEATQEDQEKRTKGWSVHEWHWWNNPYVKDQMQTAHDKLVADNPLIVETNHYKQHWQNRWVIDDTKRCYKYSPAKNLFKGDIPKNLRPDGWTIVLGVDLGWEDDTAFVRTAYHENDPRLFVLDTYGTPGMSFDGVEDTIKAYLRDPVLAPHKVVIDGANKQGVESMRLRSNIPFEYADKRDKATFIELCNADFVQAKIQILENEGNAVLCKELTRLLWDVDGDKIKLPKTENPNIANHRADALLYAWRMGYHYQAQPAEKKVVKYSAEWYRQQADDIWEREKEKLQADLEDKAGGW